MNTIKTYFFSFVANRMQTKRLLSRFSQPLIIHPFYHAITDVYLPHLTPLYKPRTFQKFKNDLDFLLEHFQPVDAGDVLLHTQGEKRLQSNAFHLSFDDGLKEVYTVAMPYLYRKGIPATIFVNSDFVNNAQLFYRYKAALVVDALAKKAVSPVVRKEIESCLPVSKLKTLQERILSISYSERDFLDVIAPLLEIDFEYYLQKQQPYLTTKQIHEMQKKGFTIGAHSIDHPLFSELPEEEQVWQVMSSISYVKRISQAPSEEQHRYFAFPFTDEGVSDDFFQTMYKKSKRGMELSFGIGGIGTRYDGRHIARIDMERYGRDAKEAIHKALLKASLRPQ